MLTNNYFCTLKYKIMKGILPVYCRTMGYVVLLLSVFVPLFMFMFGMINDSNLLFTKASIKLLIWFSLFMIFLAKVKDENEKISRIRIKAICYAIYLLGIYYIVMLVRGVYNGNLEEADNSIAIVYMVFNVICLYATLTLTPVHIYAKLYVVVILHFLLFPYFRIILST